MNCVYIYERVCARAFIFVWYSTKKGKEVIQKRAKRSFTERIIEEAKIKLINLNDREQNICQKRPKAIYIQFSFSECGWVHFPTGIRNHSVCPNAKSYSFPLRDIKLIYHFFVYFFWFSFSFSWGCRWCVQMSLSHLHWIWRGVKCAHVLKFYFKYNAVERLLETNRQFIFQRNPLNWPTKFHQKNDHFDIGEIW